MLRRAALAVFAASLFLALPATAKTVIGVEGWGVKDGVPNPSDMLDSQKAGEGAASYLESEIFRLIAEDPEFTGCEATMTEMMRRPELEKEKELSRSPYIDPRTVRTVAPTEPTHLIKGDVTPTGKGHSFRMQLVDAKTGEVLEEQSGVIDPEADMTPQLDAMARSILKKLCVPPAVQVNAAYNDLKIDEKVCDLSKPFRLKGSGATAGIFFDMQPSGAEGGSFTVGGTGGGVPWSGSGTYAVARNEGGGGTLNISGAWRITTPAGVFGDSGTIPGTFTKLPDPCKE